MPLYWCCSVVLASETVGNTEQTRNRATGPDSTIQNRTDLDGTGLVRTGLNPFRASKPAPILISSNLSPKAGFQL